MAGVFAKEMIEHNLKCGAAVLNLNYIAEQACELAYKIDSKIRDYGLDLTTETGELVKPRYRYKE